MTLSQAFGLYKQDVIVFRSQSAKTEEHHDTTLKALLRFFGEDIVLEALTFESVRDWKLSLDKRQLSPLTVRGYLIRLRVVLAHLTLLGHDVLDPERIVLPKKVVHPPSVITPEQVQALIDSTDKLRNKVMISLLYSTGLRVSELVALDRRDVLEDEFPVTGKGGKTRLCFIDERTRNLLRAYLSQRTEGYDVMVKSRGKTTDRVRYHVQGDNNVALFIRPTGQRITVSTVQEVIKVARSNAGFDWPVHPHTLRHSFATNLMRNGAHLRAIQMMMGHASVSTTQLYLTVFDPELLESFQRYHST